jgi:eukaryotic-like serine/threonine-protein kinase
MNIGQSSSRDERGPPPPEIEARLQAVVEEFLAALQRGESPDRVQTVAAHPELASWLDERLRFIELVYRAGQNADAAEGHPLPADRANRLKCPHCGNHVQLVEPRTKEVTCLNCGSSFRVEPGTTATFRPAGLPGDFGRFQIIELLGRGAFGEVYKARDSELDRLVALKMPRADYFATSEEAQRFLREARSAAGLRHSSIVQVHEIAHQRGSPYIVSDYIEGLTLADLISGGRPGFRESAELVAQLADALDYAHRQKVIHRDIKPSNILLAAPQGPDTGGPRFVPYLTDFGLARRDEGEITVTLDGQVLGTPAYMSPEQAAGDHARVDGRSDVYSLGVVLYELLSGELPFRGSRRMLLHQVLHDEPRPPRTLNERIPRDLETICLKAMAKEPGRRYLTAADFRDDLRRYVRGDPITARRVGRTERAWRWCRRNPVVAGLAAAVVIALLAGTAVSLHFASRAVAKADDEARQRDRADKKAVEAAAEAKRADDEATEARRNLYISDMHLAEQYWRDGQAGPAIELLDRYIPRPGDDDLRGWEWHYQQRLCHQELRSFVGHERAIESIAFSPDDTRLAISSVDGVKLWDVATGTLVHSLMTSTSPCVRFTPDGSQVVTVGPQKTITFWDVKSGAMQSTISDCAKRVSAIAFTPNGSQLASASVNGPIQIYDVATKMQERSFAVASISDTDVKLYISHLVFSPDATLLAKVDSMQGTFTVHDVSSGHALPAGVGNRHVSSVAFSPDGTQFVTCTSTGTLAFYDTATWKVTKTCSALANVQSEMTMALQGSRLALPGIPGCICLLDTRSARVLRNFPGHVADITYIAFNSDGSQLASGDKNGAVNLWDTSASHAPPIDVVRTRSAHYWTDQEEGGAYVSAQEFDDLPADVPAGETVRILEVKGRPREGVVFDSNGNLLAVRSQLSEDSAAVWDALSGQPRYRFVAPKGTRLESLAFDGRGKCLAVGIQSGRPTVWDVSTGEVRHAFDNAEPGCQAMLIHEGKFTLLCHAGPSHRGTDVYETLTGRRVASINPQTNLSLSSNGEMYASWSIESRGAERRLHFRFGSVFDDDRSSPSGATSWSLVSPISPDGRRLVTLDLDDGVVITLWDTATRKIEHELRGHAGKVSAAAFSPDGRRLASAGKDGTVKLWDVSSGQQLRNLAGHAGPAIGVGFSPDGYYLASTSEDGTIRIYDARPWSTELAVENEAVSIVRLLCADATSLTDLLERVRARRNISEPVRERASSLAEEYWLGEMRSKEIVPGRLNYDAWLIVVRRNAEPDEYQRALRWAETACRLEPDDGFNLNTLGLAQYRVGRFDEALATLTRSLDLNNQGTGEPHPADVAFLALAHHALGHQEDAKELLKRLRGLAGQAGWLGDAEVQAFLLEAEERIGVPMDQDTKPRD